MLIVDNMTNREMYNEILEDAPNVTVTLEKTRTYPLSITHVSQTPKVGFMLSWCHGIITLGL